MKPMTRTNIVLIGVLMIATSVFAHLAKPTKYMAEVSPRAKLTTELPKEIKHWTSLKTDNMEVIDPAQKTVLDYLYSETVNTSYVDNHNHLIMLSIAYGKDQSDGHEVHQPSICYPAQGFVILKQKELPLILDSHRHLTVHYMYTQNGQRIEPLIYWSTSGDYVYQSTLQRKLIEFKYSQSNLIPDGMILRISTIEKDPAIALNSLTTFVKDWYASMPEIQRNRYFGMPDQ